MKKMMIFLVIYSTIVTLAFISSLYFAIEKMTTARFDAIDVQRINLVEPDGSVRLVISNKNKFPGMIFHGKEIPHPGRSGIAGMIFYNDEGTENGGLIFHGKSGPDNKPDAFVSFTFDKYDQDQVVQLLNLQEGGTEQAGLIINDRSNQSMSLDKVANIGTMSSNDREEVFGAKQRVFLGKDGDRSAILQMSDIAGRPRIRMQVSASGNPSLVFLDEQGNPIETIGPK